MVRADRDRERRQFLQLMVRLRRVAERHGDTTFADALIGCLREASRGAPGCPIADLLGRQHIVPPGASPPTEVLLPMGLTEPPYDRDKLFEYVHRALRGRAALHGDTQFVEALHACLKHVQADDRCPMHRLLNQP
jgi:hypothetical protein